MIRKTDRPTNNIGVPFKDRVKGMKPGRSIKRCEGMSKHEEEGVVKLFDELAPEYKDGCIDIAMIVDKAFPVFEETLGTANWTKVKRYFGIEGKSPAKNIKKEEVLALISKLRTIENAQYYLEGFSELLERYAEKLLGAPEDMTSLEKAKAIRLFMLFYGAYYFFAEDYVMPMMGREPVLSYKHALLVNKKTLYPEEMFYLYKASVHKYSNESFLYDAIIGELKVLDKRIRKEVLEVAELKLVDGDRLVSVNVKPSNTSFGYIRGIKKRMFSQAGYFPAELYAVKDLWSGIEFGELYTIYKTLKMNELSTFKKHLKKAPCIEGNRIFEHDAEYYVIADSIEMGGKEEIDRYIRLVELLAAKNMVMPIDVIAEGDSKKIITQQIEIGKFFAFLRMAYNFEYLTAESTTADEYNIYLEFLDLDPDGKHFKAYMNGEISDEELKALLGIDKKFEEEVLGIKHVETPMDAVKRFAVETGILDNPEELSEELANNVLISGNENLWTRYSEGKLDTSALAEKLGIDQEIKEMYFSLSKIDIQAIEQKLQELKTRRVSAKEMKRNALTINLYCYIVEGQISCGPKNKIPKGNKRLKPDNLRKLIAA